ncbi:YicC/YloC family endoribonuclease [Neotabrizicola shimadae]|uniref:YicC family protein n=1 Tax=Neotabrizicola shimadae TaxID=2807096 RepID=A0A8G1EDE9_9RHOB|nr:YicC/YloC family endoribonuclease [Neotabrizicola shimadae]QYZ71590.1 YicC family protein [Neotabrizicola shimadae]
MITSMTGFASQRGQGAGYDWTWDLRSVNGKGLELRLRVPDWIEGLEPAIRTELTKAASRGSVSLTLKVAREAGGAEAATLNTAVLSAAISALAEVEQAAMSAGLTLAPSTPADLLSLRGVLDTAPADEDTTPLRAAILADLPALLFAFNAMRAAEGRALDGIITAQLDRIAALVEDATAAAGDRRIRAEATLRDGLDRLRGAVDSFDEQRVAQELALLAVKADVAEELDRLTAHVAAARALLKDKGPVGRKLDFLMQEFMREANTLCSKAGDLALTRIGLDLKTVIDQMREQVQNVE